MKLSILDKWERAFREESLADDFKVFREHLQRLELPDRPDLMLEGTIDLVRLCCAYSALDNRNKKFQEFLAIQNYDPVKANEAKYAYTFDVHGMAYARVFVGAEEKILDLADIYGSPWHKHQVCGFGTLWISHPDWSILSKEEVFEIERAVTNDILYDYSEEELNFWCDGSHDDTYVLVNIQDAYDEESET